MGPGGGNDEQQKRKKFEKKQQRQLQAVDFGPAGFGLDVEAPKNKAGNLAAAKTVPQNVDRRERWHGSQRNQRERISEERNHAGTSS